MRIAVTCALSWPYIRRGNRCAWDHARNLAQDGHEVHLVMPGPGRRRVQVEQQGVTMTYLPLRERMLLTAVKVQKLSTFAWSCARFLRDGGFDLVQSTYPIDAYAAHLHRVACGTPYVHLLIDCLPFHPEIRLGRTMFRRGIASASRLVAISRFVSDHLRAEYDTEAVVVPLPVDTERFPARLTPRSGPPRILCTASVRDPRKRVDLLVCAFDRLLADVPDAVLELAGDTDESRTRELLGSVSDRARRAIIVPGLGRREDLPGRYQDATLSVLPSVDEALGLVVLESLASGTYVAATRSGAVPDILEDPGVGLLFDREAGPECVAEVLKDALIRAAEPETPSRCRRHVEARYTWEQIGPQYARIYEEVCAATGPRRPAPHPGHVVKRSCTGGSETPEASFDEALERADVSGDEFFTIDWHRPACLRVLRWLRDHPMSARRAWVVGPHPRAFEVLLRHVGFEVEVTSAIEPCTAASKDLVVCDDGLPYHSDVDAALRVLSDSLVTGGYALLLTGTSPHPVPPSSHRVPPTTWHRVAGCEVAGRLADCGLEILDDERIQGRSMVRRDWGSTPLKTTLRRLAPATLAVLLPALREHRFVAARKLVPAPSRVDG